MGQYSVTYCKFGGTEDDCHIILRLLIPTKAPQVFFDEHSEHLTIEFRSGVTAAYKEMYGE
jgi:hypothetical protein